MPFKPGEYQRAYNEALRMLRYGASYASAVGRLIQFCNQLPGGCDATSQELRAVTSAANNSYKTTREAGRVAGDEPISRGVGLPREQRQLFAQNSYRVRVDCYNEEEGGTVGNIITISSPRQLSGNELSEIAMQRTEAAIKNPTGPEQLRGVASTDKCTVTLLEYLYVNE